jgi:nucleoside-diphosphate-sugar epimerase
MRVLVTGANGFIGRALAARLLQPGALPGVEVTRLVLLDQAFDHPPTDARVQQLAGDIADPGVLRQALVDGVQFVFHLASVPGGLAERDYELGHRVNLLATHELFLQLREQATPAVVVFASSIAVYGALMPDPVDEDTQANPHLSYGAHKLVGEMLLRDISRRGWIDGRALRLPGVVARPRGPSGLLSAYMSDILHALAAGEPCTCPVSAQAVSWWMSAACCVDNLLHAALVPAANLNAQRTWVLPVLRITMAELVDALVRRYGSDRRALLRYEPIAALEAAFGRYPPLLTPGAEAVGFRHDGSIDLLLQRALGDRHGA